MTFWVILSFLPPQEIYTFSLLTSVIDQKKNMIKGEEQNGKDIKGLIF